VKGEGIAAMLTTPENIRALQRKLYHKAKQEKAYRFYALYDKIYRADILSHAYNLVRANKGSAGIDGVTFEAIETGEGITAFLVELEEALKSKTYRPDPVKRVMIPKANGDKRPLGIPTIRDRVAQMAVKLVIEPIFEADFCDNSYGSVTAKYFASSSCGSKPRSWKRTRMERKGTLAAARETAKAPRKEESSRRCYQTCICIFWIGYGNGINWRGNSEQESCVMRTMSLFCAGVEPSVRCKCFVGYWSGWNSP
jgi:hypothetical protein